LLAPAATSGNLQFAPVNDALGALVCPALLFCEINTL